MPNIGAIREDKLLSNLSVKYRNMEFIADEMFGMVPVKKNSDRYRIYERNFRLPETSRAMGAESNSHTFDVSVATYILERHSLHDPVPDPLADNYDIGDLRADTTEELTDTILRRREKSFLDLFTTTNWSLNTSLAAAAAWNANTTTSNPILAVDTATSQVLLNSGQRANVGLIAHNALESLKNHVSVLDRVKHVSADVSEIMLAGLFGIEKLKVSAAGIDTSAKGATSSLSFLMLMQGRSILKFFSARLIVLLIGIT